MKDINIQDPFAFTPMLLQFAPVAIISGVARWAYIVVTATENGHKISRQEWIAEMIIAALSGWGSMSFMLYWNIDIGIASPISMAIATMGYKGFLSIIKTRIKDHLKDGNPDVKP